MSGAVIRYMHSITANMTANYQGFRDAANSRKQQHSEHESLIGGQKSDKFWREQLGGPDLTRRCLLIKE
jgi:hypothetical protein